MSEHFLSDLQLLLAQHLHSFKKIAAPISVTNKAIPHEGPHTALNGPPESFGND